MQHLDITLTPIIALLSAVVQESGSSSRSGVLSHLAGDWFGVLGNSFLTVSSWKCKPFIANYKAYHFHLSLKEQHVTIGQWVPDSYKLHIENVKEKILLT